MKPSFAKAKPTWGLAIAIQCAILCSLALGLANGVTAASYQEPCTDVRIDFQNVLAQAKLVERENPRFDEAAIQKIVDLLQAATANPQCLFITLSDGEAFSLIKALCRLEDYFVDKSSSEQIFLWDSFLRQYPRSSHLDEARWLRVKTAATPYEYEGVADAALQQIKTIEVFIKDYTDNSYLPEAELELARACRIAYETYRYGEGLSMTSNEDRQAAGGKYRDRARQLLQHLCDHSSDPARSQACQALQDLTEGRCVYMGPGSPNPNVQDNWAVSQPR